MTDIDELRRLLAEATPGVPLDWRAHGDCIWGSDPARIDKDVPSDLLVEAGTEARAALIFAAVNNLPALLDELAALRADRDLATLPFEACPYHSKKITVWCGICERIAFQIARAAIAAAYSSDD